MPRTAIKEMLQSMTKEDIIELVLDMYATREQAKEYLDYHAEPDENSKLDEYKAIIKDEFYPANKRKEPKARFTICRQTLESFKKFKPSADALAELMVSYMEWVTKFTYDYGEMRLQYYDALVCNFGKTIQHLVATRLWDKYEIRLEQCTNWLDDIDNGVSDTIWSMCERGRSINEYVATHSTIRISETRIKRMFHN